MSDRNERFAQLPERPAPEELRTSQDADLSRDEGDEELRELEWLLKYGGI
jgi:hypothetical protein